MAQEERPRAPGLRGDVARLFSWEGTTGGRPSLGAGVRRALTRPDPQAVALYRASHWLWERGLRLPAEVVWRANYFLTGPTVVDSSNVDRVAKLVQEGYR